MFSFQALLVMRNTIQILKLREQKGIISITLIFLMLLFPMKLSSQDCSEEYFDGVFQGQMKEHNIAGLTMAFTMNDTIQMIRSYGYSNVETLKQTSASSGFKIGSVSKLFIWVSIMQLWEDGLVDLNAPVNNYLEDFKLPDDYQPVTILNLMNHTPGFEDTFLNLFEKSHEELPELETYLRENLPQQVFEPGTVPAYSNYGSALAAYLVEQVSGQSFSAYVDERILKPLGMNETTFRQPAPSNINQNQSKGYLYAKGQWVSPFDEYFGPYPAGGAISSANDMMKFMRFFLDPVNTQDSLSKVLEPETVSKILETTYSPDPEVPGMAHGLIKMTYKNLDLFSHVGDTYFFHTGFYLIPEKNTGLFFSINTANTGFARKEQLHLLLNYLFQLGESPEQSPRVNIQNHYEGTYISSRTPQSDFSKLLGAAVSQFKISRDENGILFTINNSTTLYKPYEKDVFVDKDGNKLIFERGEKGGISQVYLSQIPVISLRKITFRENMIFNFIFFIIALIFTVKNLSVPLISLFGKRVKSKQLFRWLLFFSSAFLLIFFIIFATRFTTVEDVLFNTPESLRLIMLLPLLALFFFALTVVFWLQRGVWRRQPFGKTLWHFLVFLIMLVFYSQMHFWNFFNVFTL